MSRSRARIGAPLLGALLSLSLCLCAPAFGQDGRPDLRQRLEPDQAVVGGERVVSAGHVDVGPRFLGGRWTLMVHDDTAKAAAGGPSVWRHAERTVLWVKESAVLRVPDDPAYGFLHAEPGAEVYVVPQTQDPGVVWVGWNTQDPEVMERIDRGVTLTLLGVEGPGSLVVYLQSGDFAAPSVLWDSTAKAKPIWVDVNTHTHANWVFSAPGVYLVRVRAEAELIDGSTVSDTRDLRFAVGSRTAPAAALAAAWQGPVPGDRSPTETAATERPPEEEGGSPATGLIAVLVLAGTGLAAGLALALVRGGRAKRRARGGTARSGGGGEQGVR